MFYNQQNRIDNPNEQLKDKDQAGRYLSTLLLNQLGYQLIPSMEKYDKGDDIYTNHKKQILVESRTNIRLLDMVIQRQADVCQWVRRDKSESDLYINWGAYSRNSWVGVVILSHDVKSAPIKPRGASNVVGKENVRYVPYNTIKMVCLVTSLSNQTTRVEYWDYRKNTIPQWHVNLLPVNTSHIQHPVDVVCYNLQPFTFNL